MSFLSWYKLHYKGHIYKYETTGDIKENINVTCMGVGIEYINFVKYALGRQDMKEQK
jgi:hypothetical protein